MQARSGLKPTAADETNKVARTGVQEMYLVGSLFPEQHKYWRMYVFIWKSFSVFMCIASNDPQITD